MLLSFVIVMNKPVALVMQNKSACKIRNGITQTILGELRSHRHHPKKDVWSKNVLPDLWQHASCVVKHCSLERSLQANGLFLLGCTWKRFSTRRTDIHSHLDRNHVVGLSKTSLRLQRENEN